MLSSLSAYEVILLPLAVYFVCCSNRAVRGLVAWCQVCGHGGHLEHMNKWHQDNEQCPAGCGHLCARSGGLA